MDICQRRQSVLLPQTSDVAGACAPPCGNACCRPFVLQAADANAVHWARTVTAAIKAVDPNVLVAVGLFTNAAVNKGPPNGLPPVAPGSKDDPRFVRMCERAR